MNSQSEIDQWEALDLGDSELPSFLRPCKRKSPSRSLQPPNPQQNPKAGFNSHTNHHLTLRRCSLPDHFLEDSYSRSLIPGPAGTVQAAIRRKMNKDPRSFNQHGEPIPTQEFIRKAAEEPDSEDKDFSKDPWISAVSYIRREGLLSNSGDAIGTPVSKIKREHGRWSKVDQVVAIIKTCTPNGLGDIMVTLKDPTGTIDASVHRKVISESEFGRDIRVGAVVILKKVAVCAPSGSSRYLNITLKNISKVISKDTPVSSKQKHSETNSKNPVPVNENEEHLRMQHKVFPVDQGTTQGIMNSLRQTAKESSEALTDVEMEDVNPVEGSSLWLKGVTKKKHGEARIEQTLSGNCDTVSQTEIAANRISSSMHEHQLHEDIGTDMTDDIRLVKQMSGNHEPNSGELESVMGSIVEVASGCKVNKSQPMESSSSVSVPQWTDEQLEELFAFD